MRSRTALGVGVPLLWMRSNYIFQAGLSQPKRVAVETTGRLDVIATTALLMYDRAVNGPKELDSGPYHSNERVQQHHIDCEDRQRLCQSGHLLPQRRDGAREAQVECDVQAADVDS